MLSITLQVQLGKKFSVEATNSLQGEKMICNNCVFNKDCKTETIQECNIYALKVWYEISCLFEKTMKTTDFHKKLDIIISYLEAQEKFGEVLILKIIEKYGSIENILKYNP